MASFNLFERDVNPVLFEGNACVKKVILNRPRKLNSLTYEMISQIEVAMKSYESDSRVKLVILKGNGKAFCAGGDLLKVFQLLIAGGSSFVAKFYGRQLRLDYLLATYTKPLVVLIDGIVMGGGAGLSMHGKFRIVTENTVFAMPEASIGLFPDVGASYFLSRLPGYFGEYLALTGAKIEGFEMLASGLATHFVLSKDLQPLENALYGLASSDISAISMLINQFTYKLEGHTKQDTFSKRLEIITKCFSRETVEEILLSLEKEVAGGTENWLLDAITSLKSVSPTILKVALRLVRVGRAQKLESCMAREYIACYHAVRRTVNDDLYEGVKTLLTRKDKKCKWNPSELSQVSEEMVDKYFVANDDNDIDWEPLQLPTRSTPTNPLKSKL